MPQSWLSRKFAMPVGKVASSLRRDSAIQKIAKKPIFSFAFKMRVV